MPHGQEMVPERWSRLMEAWGFDRNQQTYDALVAAYTEKGRYYHTSEHISACLRHLDDCGLELEFPREVEIALWFHDAIYKPLSRNNERKSADWAAEFLRENGAKEEEATRVHRLIIATEHDALPLNGDESALIDIDLSILGADPATYEVFEKNVRKEYRLVPSFIYKRKRAEILQGFLERPQIYSTERFSRALERQARENLANAIARLKDREA